ncbi:MAG: fructosamine kinase family protein [Crocinitomicaceae bacterium]
MQELFDLLFPGASIQKLIGGDINDVFKISKASSTTVLKVNRKDDFPNMFEKEANGLAILNETFKTPNVIQTGSHDNWQYLELEFLPEKTKKEDYWTVFAEKLSKTHQKTSKRFGFNENNFMGSLVQVNDTKSTWAEFLIDCRLNPMIEMAVNAGEVNYVEAKIIEKFYNRIVEIYPEEQPALLHGDLWGGNYLSSTEGPVLIDPAVYYGHREMDLAMMQLFGGFDAEVFEVYNELFPLENEWRDRVEYNQLYPLLVHLNLFGRSYWEKVNSILKPFA